MKITPLEPWIHQKISAAQPFLTRQELEAWQLRKLNETLALARAKSPFYSKLLAKMPGSIHHLTEWATFPFTTPEEIRCSALQFLCVSQDEIQRVVTLQSSGTTGEPKRLFFTKEDQELTIDFFGVGMSTLTEPGDKVLILLPGSTPGSVGHLLQLGLERLGRQALPHGPGHEPLQTLEFIHTQKIDCLVGSPIQVLALARYWQPSWHKPRSVLLSTDTVPEAIVNVLQQTWGCDVYNHYGTTEMGLGGGVECAAHRGYHLREADLFFEVINPNTGEPAPEGEPGEVVFTTLTRQGMPLIRYRMGDQSRFILGPCPCGTCLKTLEKVSGRINAGLSIKNGVLKLGELDEVLFPIPGLLNYFCSLTGESGKEVITIDACMSTAQDSKSIIEQALRTIPSLYPLKMIIHCQQNLQQAVHLSKRSIIDKRGQHA